MHVKVVSDEIWPGLSTKDLLRKGKTGLVSNIHDRPSQMQGHGYYGGRQSI
jgi:hypothetical protein